MIQIVKVPDTRHNPPQSEGVTPLIGPNNLNFAIHSLNVGMGWDQVHTNSIKFSGPVFRIFLVKYFNKCIDQSFFAKRNDIWRDKASDKK